MRGTPQYFIFMDAARSGYPGIIYAISSPTATNYCRAPDDNASRIFRTLRETLQDTPSGCSLSFLFARGNYPVTFYIIAVLTKQLSALHRFLLTSRFLTPAEISW